MKMLEKIAGRMAGDLEKYSLFFVLGILLASLSMRVYVMGQMGEIKHHADEREYEGLAGDFFGYWNDNHSSSPWMRPPGYVFFMFVVKSVFGSFDSVIYTQLVISAVSSCLLFYVGRSMFNWKVGLLSCAISSVYPDFITYSGFFFSETLMIFFFLMFTVFFLKYLDGGGKGSLIWAGFFLGVSSLIKSASMYVAPASIVLVLWTEKGRGKGGLKTGVLNSVLFLTCFLVAISPVTIRNYRNLDRIVLIDVTLGQNMNLGWYPNQPTFDVVNVDSRIGNAIGYSEALDKTPVLKRCSRWKYPNIVDRDACVVDKCIRFLYENPDYAVRHVVIKFFRFWNPTSFFLKYMIGSYKGSSLAFNVKYGVLTAISYVLVMLFAVHGFCFSPNNRKKLFMCMVIFIFSVGPILSNPISRYRLHLTPFLIMFAAYSIVEFYSITHRNALNIAAFVFLSAVFFGFFLVQCPNVTGYLLWYVGRAY